MGRVDPQHIDPTIKRSQIEASRISLFFAEKLPGGFGENVLIKTEGVKRCLLCLKTNPRVNGRDYGVYLTGLFKGSALDSGQGRRSVSSIGRTFSCIG